MDVPIRTLIAWQLAGLLAADPHPEVRQVAMIDAQGRVAAHTGEDAILAAGHQTGEAYSVQANLMEHATVWPAMARAFESTEGDLAARMLARSSASISPRSRKKRCALARLCS